MHVGTQETFGQFVKTLRAIGDVAFELRFPVVIEQVEFTELDAERKAGEVARTLGRGVPEAVEEAVRSYADGG